VTRAPARAPGSGAAAGGLTFASAIADLEAAEQQVYGTAFQGFNAGRAVEFSHPGLQDYVATNSGLSMEDAYTEILKAASKTEEMEITMDSFMELLRDNAAEPTAMLERFLNLADGSDQVDAGSCRSGLLMFTNDHLGSHLTASLNEARWDDIFDSVMVGAGASVNMEGWNSYCKRVARIVRVVNLGKL